MCKESTEADPQVNHTYLDNNTPGTPYTVSSAVTDAAGAAATDSTTIDVANVTPKVTITGVMAGRPFAPAGIDVPLMATFTDPGALDTHVGAVTWGDGSATNLGAVQRSGLSATHAFASPGNYQVEAAVTDKDNGAGTATTSVTVLSPGAAADAITGLLKGLLGRGDAQTDALLRTAIDQLGSRNSGVATNGAAALLRGGDRVAALEKLGKAETALRAVTRLDVAVVRLLIAQTAQSVAQTAAGNARAAAGCTVLTATSCTATERKAITAIDQLITSGQTALGSGAYATAIAAFKDAT